MTMARMSSVVTPGRLRAADAEQAKDIESMTTKKNWNAKDEVTYLAGIQKYWIGYLLRLFGKALLIVVVGLCTAASIAVWFPWILSRFR